MATTKLILVGGFLGAGKTSLLYRAADILRAEGEKAALITNDQAAQLVDTAFLEGTGSPVYEVNGSCFCCNFPGFADAVTKARDDNGGGVTIAEPVGSCTDLSATIMQPLKDRYQDLADLAPLTVLADPERLSKLLDGEEDTAAYIVSRQFDEADIILINKIDLLSEEEREALIAKAKERWPETDIMTVSAKSGEGVAEWLETVRSRKAAGNRLAVVDYDRYAAGEAAYGWLNAAYTFNEKGNDYAADAKAFLDKLAEAFDSRSIAVGHVKFMLYAGTREWIGNLTGTAETASLREVERETGLKTLIVNARVETGPKLLQDIVVSAIDEVFAGYYFTGTTIRCLIPGRPNPTYRYREVVGS